MDLDLLTRYQEDAEPFIFTAVHWRDDTVSLRATVQTLPQPPAGEPRLSLAGLVGPPEVAASLLDDAGDRMDEQASARAAAPGVGPRDETVWKLRDLSAVYHGAAESARRFLQGWEEPCADVRTVRFRDAAVAHILIHPLGAVFCYGRDPQGAAQRTGRTDPFEPSRLRFLGRIDNYRNHGHQSCFRAATASPEELQQFANAGERPPGHGPGVAARGCDEPVIVRDPPRLDHPAVHAAHDAAWHDHILAWYISACEAGRIRETGTTAFYVDEPARVLAKIA